MEGWERTYGAKTADPTLGSHLSLQAHDSETLRRVWLSPVPADSQCTPGPGSLGLSAHVSCPLGRCEHSGQERLGSRPHGHGLCSCLSCSFPAYKMEVMPHVGQTRAPGCHSLGAGQAAVSSFLFSNKVKDRSSPYKRKPHWLSRPVLCLKTS